MKIYIVTARYGTEMEEPVVYKSCEEATKNAERYIRASVMDVYDGAIHNPTNEDLIEWAESKGFAYSEWYFWDGGDAVEVNVSEVEI